MSHARSNSQAAERALERIQDKLHGLPLPGVRIGGGMHAEMPGTWQGRDVSPGWSSYEGSSAKHPTRNEWATPVDSETSTALADTRAARLTGSERAALVAANRDKSTLTEDWSEQK